MNEIVFTTIDGIDELPNKEFESCRSRNKHHQVLYVCMYVLRFSFHPVTLAVFTTHLSPYNLSVSFFLFLSFPAKQSGPRSEWFVFGDGMFAFCAPYHPIVFPLCPD